MDKILVNEDEAIQATLELMGLESVEAFKNHLMDIWQETGRPPKEVTCILPEVEIMGVRVRFARERGRIPFMVSDAETNQEDSHPKDQPQT